jgi:peptidoglycan biosynthesis protein MviN/MurJ (putative lipid II flippase)
MTGRILALARRGMIPAIVFCGLLVGFGREIMLAYLYGVSEDLEVYRVATGLPTILSDGLAISFISAMLSPIAAARAKDRDHEVALTWSLLLATAIFVAGLFIVGVLTAPLQASLLAPGFTGQQKASTVAGIAMGWPLFLFVGTSLALRSLLSAHGRKWPAASASVIRSGIFVLIVLAATALAPQMSGYRMLILATVCGGAVVLAVHGAALTRDIRGLFSDALRQRPAIGVSPLVLLAAMGWVIVYQASMASQRLIDRAYASTLDQGSLAAMDYGYALVVAGAMLMATSFNILYMPAISRAIHEPGASVLRFRNRIALPIAVAAVIGILASFQAPRIVEAVFGYGAFDAAAASLTAESFGWQVMGLGAMIASLIFAQVLIVAGKIALKLCVLWGLSGMGIASIGISFVAAETFMAVMAGILIILYPTRMGADR